MKFKVVNADGVFKQIFFNEQILFWADLNRPNLNISKKCVPMLLFVYLFYRLLIELLSL